MERQPHGVLKGTKVRWDHKGNQGHQHLHSLMKLRVIEVSRDSQVRRGRKVTADQLGPQDCLGGPDLWVLKVSPSWALMDLLVHQASLGPRGSAVLALEVPLDPLDHQDLQLHMDQLPMFLDLRDPQDHQDPQDMQTQ